jgi:acetylornithine/N-succinyldiaminopimelate aminotransferase
MGMRMNGNADARPWVVKIGGRLCEERQARMELAIACARIEAPLVVVHGGGAQVSRLQRALGLEARFHEGLRVTSAEDLDVVEMALSGSTNQALVRALLAAGLRAVGISGCDGSLVRCRLVTDLGRVGTPTAVDDRIVTALLAAGLTPVISPVSLGPDGEAVNVNADEVACALAAALGAERLLLLSDVQSVTVRGEPLSEVGQGEVESLIASGQVTDGMIPKLRAAAAAANAVAEVRIGTFDGRPLAEIDGTRIRGRFAGHAKPAERRLPAEAQVLAGVFQYPRLLLERGEGSYVWDVDRRRYLDFTSGLGVAALGHGRRDLAAALGEQFARLGHCSNLFGNVPSLELAARLKDSSFASRIWFANSGTETIEAAIKFSRLHGRALGGARKTAIVAFKGGFHGRSMGALSATYDPHYRRPFAPLVAGVRFADFNAIESVRRVIDDRVCAVLVEPVQGEGGVVPAKPEFLHELRALCDAHQALLVFDEVQCGLGRLGHLHAYQAYGVLPDLVAIAKPIAAGLPLGALLIGEPVAELLKPGQHGSTFSGGPAVCAVALRVLEAIAEPAFLQRVQELGRRLRAGLDRLAGESPLFQSARGMGLMQALVVAETERHPPAEIVSAARQRGLLVTRAGTDAVRLLPPLNVSESEIDEALATLREVAESITGSRRAPIEALAGAGGRP